MAFNVVESRWFGERSRAHDGEHQLQKAHGPHGHAILGEYGLAIAPAR
jgi:hypothetical protein